MEGMKDLNLKVYTSAVQFGCYSDGKPLYQAIMKHN